MCCAKNQIEKVAYVGGVIVVASIFFCLGRESGFKSAAENVRNNIKTFMFPRMSEESVKEFADVWNSLCK